MKHQYFGDVNDYRKYGLLRCLIEATGLTLGVAWWLTSDDGRTDGEFRGYLQRPELWRRFDPVLFDRLSGLLDPATLRHTSLARRWDLLPGGVYHDALVEDARPRRLSHVEKVGRELSNCSLVVLDPDNGIEVSSVPLGGTNSSKYVYWHEIEELFHRGHSLVIYQHYPHISRDVFEASLLNGLQTRLGKARLALFSTAHVVFALALQPEHAAHLDLAAAKVGARWSGQIRISRSGFRAEAPAT